MRNATIQLELNSCGVELFHLFRRLLLLFLRFLRPPSNRETGGSDSESDNSSAVQADPHPVIRPPADIPGQGNREQHRADSVACGRDQEECGPVSLHSV